METLSDKIRFGYCNSKARTAEDQVKMIKAKHVKESIGNAFAEISALLTPCMECAKDKRIDKVVQIFKQNFGDKLI